MNEHEMLINQFYLAFDQLDAGKMISCYHRDVLFQDPAFGELAGEEVGNMWRMLCQSQKKESFDVRVSNIMSDGSAGSADWEARYIFSRTGRKVHNKISASFEFREGKIVRHVDDFNLYRWSRQALGATGLLIGWTPFFKNSLQKQTKGLLEKFTSGRASQNSH